MSFDLSEHLRLLVVSIILVSLGAAIVGGGIISSDAFSGEERFDPGDGTFEIATINDVPSGAEVSLTRERAVESNGSGYVDVELGEQWNQGNWSVMLTGDLSDDANQNASYTAFAHANETILIQWRDGQWWAYHDSGSADASVAVNASTAEQPVVVTWENATSELSIETSQEQATATADTNTESREVAWDWAGTLDEVRVLESEPTANDTSSYLDEPVAPLPDSEDQQHARLMLDEGEGSTTEVFYLDRDATLVEAGWGAGVDGPGLEEGQDFEFGEEPFAVEPLNGGLLIQSPVAYVTWGDRIGGVVSAVVGVLPTLLFLLILVGIGAKVQEKL